MSAAGKRLVASAKQAKALAKSAAVEREVAYHALCARISAALYDALEYGRARYGSYAAIASRVGWSEDELLSGLQDAGNLHIKELADIVYACGCCMRISCRGIEELDALANARNAEAAKAQEPRQ